MHSFTDSAGHQWDVRLDALTLGRIEEKCGISILSTTNEERALSNFMNLQTLMKILVASLAEALKQRNITEDDFKRALDGPALDLGCEAVSREIEDLFRSTRRAHLADTMSKSREAMIKSNAEAATRIRAIDVQRVVAGAMKKLDSDLTKLLAGGEAQ